MYSPCRTTASSVRSLVRASKAQQVSMVQARSHLPSSSSSYSSSCSSSSSNASTSQTSSPRSFRTFHSSVKINTNRHSKKTEHNVASPPMYNTPLTPKAAKTVAEAQAWLQGAFPGLPLPDDVAMMMITHESWDFGLSYGHNRRFSFLGRRAMKFYMSLFLSMNEKGVTLLNSDKITQLLHTSKLGESVGRSLKLGEVMRWTPAVNDGQKGPKETGLYKIRGTTVEALVGAIYHQHGAQAARGFFSCRILPFLNTFSESESEMLKESITSEARAGELSLQSIGKTIGPVSEGDVSEEQSHNAAMTGKEANLVGDTTKPTTSSPLSPSSTGARRRTVLTAARGSLSFQEESRSNVRSPPEGQSAV